MCLVCIKINVIDIGWMYTKDKRFIRRNDHRRLQAANSYVSYSVVIVSFFFFFVLIINFYFLFVAIIFRFCSVTKFYFYIQIIRLIRWKWPIQACFVYVSVFCIENKHKSNVFVFAEVNHFNCSWCFFLGRIKRVSLGRSEHCRINQMKLSYACSFHLNYIK